MVDKYRNRKEMCFFEMSEEETKILATRFPIDFLHVFKVSPTKTRSFDSKSPKDRLKMQRFEGLCELLNFPINQSQRLKTR